MRNRFLVMKFVFIALLVLGSTNLYSQQQFGELVVRVTDQTGGVMPGATVIMTSEALMRPVEGVTDSLGIFRYPVLPAGSYTITASAPGFTTAIQEEVGVEIGRTYAISLALDVATVEETVTVTAVSPVVDTVKSESAGVFKGEDLTKTPGARDYTQYAAYMPSVNMDQMSGRSSSHKGSPDGTQTSQYIQGISVDGSSGAENVFYVDGIDTTSMYNGLSNQGIRTEMVQELQVKTAGYEAQFGGAMGGVMSVVTRSGGNRFSGSAFTYFGGSALTGGPRKRLRLDPTSDVDVAEYTQDPEDSQTRTELGFTLGGPIVRDRLWFFSSFIPQYTKRERDVDFLSGESGTYNRDLRMINFLGKVDYQPHESFRINGSFAMDPNRREGGLPSYDGTSNYDYSWGEEGYDYPSRTYMLSTSWVPNTAFLLDGRYGLNYLGKSQFLDPPGVRNYFYESNGLIGFSQDHPLYKPRGWSTFGSSAGYFTAKDDQGKSTLGMSGSYYFEGGGQHNIKFGYQFNRLSQDIDDAYKFDRIYWRFTRVWTTTEGQPMISSCTGPDGNVYTPCGYFMAYTPFGTIADIHTDRHAFYLQDGWTIGNRLTMNVGMRFEKEAIPSFSDLPEFAGSAAEWGFGDKMAPRLGASFDVLGDGKLKAFGSWGWFYDAMKLEMAEGSFGGMKWKAQYYLLDDDSLDWTQYGGLNGEGPYPGTYIETRDWRIPSFDTLDPDIKAMRMTEVVAGVEYEMAPRTALSFRFVHKNVDEAIEDVGVFTPEGEMYYITNPGRGYSVSKFIEAGLPPTPKPHRTYNAGEIRLQKRFSNNWSTDISYTYSRLRGLYSGLASSDEDGRLSPNVDRDFDGWFLNYDSRGNLINGPLNTDRPHQVKAMFSYEFPFGLYLGAFFRVMSGSPISRTVDIENMEVMVENRGSDGRNPTWSQTDIYLTQRFQPFADPGKAIEINFNVLNLFNQDTALTSYRLMNRDWVALWSPGDDTNIFPYDYQALMAAEGVDVDPRFLMPNRFLAPIEARIGIKFVF